MGDKTLIVHGIMPIEYCIVRSNLINLINVGFFSGSQLFREVSFLGKPASWGNQFLVETRL